MSNGQAAEGCGGGKTGWNGTLDGCENTHPLPFTTNAVVLGSRWMEARRQRIGAAQRARVRRLEETRTARAEQLQVGALDGLLRRVADPLDPAGFAEQPDETRAHAALPPLPGWVPLAGATLVHAAIVVLCDVARLGPLS